jgi:putative secretion ATPase (PEP-CTERM system associated)
MYESYFNLTAAPFQLTPDHRYFYASAVHKRAMGYLTFGLNQGEGFVVITGEVGAGKTTLVGHLLDRLDRNQFVSARIVTTHLDADDSLRMVASAFGLAIQSKDKASLLRDIEAFLVATEDGGRHALLVVDEAQNLSLPALEELRMLSNFQKAGRSLVQIFLLGQPQFRALMGRPEMEQLRQRVIASCHLEPLDEDETRAYIEHRLRMVGWRGDPSFTPAAFSLLHAHSGGVPRRINTLCGRLLLYGFLEDRHAFDETAIIEVVSELAEEGTQQSSVVPSLPPMSTTTQPAAALGVADDPLPESYGGVLSTLDERVAALVAEPGRR